MLKVFNSLNCKVSCLGNHDLDFGVETMKDLTGRTAPCKWLISNINVEGKPIGDLQTFTTEHVTLTNGQRLKVGFFGLAGPDWPGQMSPACHEELEYTEYVEKGREMAAMLRTEPHNCDLIVALTHMRVNEDRILAAEVQGIDLILGGHDHSYVTEVNENTGVFLIKSGTDFEEFSDFSLFCGVINESDFASVECTDTPWLKHLYSKQKQMFCKIEKVQITANLEKDPEVEAHVEEKTSALNEKLN